MSSFEEGNRPRVVYVAVDEAPELYKLQETVSDLADRAGFQPAEFPFTPHITLGRFTRLLGFGESKAATGAEIAAGQQLHSMDTPMWLVDGASLMQSARNPESPSGIEYRVISHGKFS